MNNNIPETVINKVSKLTKSLDDADFLHTLFGNFYNDIISGSLQVILFGAGQDGILLYLALKVHQINIISFCDTNPNTIGRQFEGIPVISIQELLNGINNDLKKVIIIPTSSSYVQRINDDLLNAGFQSGMIQIPPIDQLLFYVDRTTQHWWNMKDLQTYESQLQNVYNLLADQKSKDIFIHRIALFCGAYDYESYKKFIDSFGDVLIKADNDYFINKRFDDNYFYFNNDVFSLKDNELFANVGALVGECALEFVKSCNDQGVNYKGIVNLEPDPSNFQQLLKNTSHLPGVHCLPYGAWSSTTRLRFSNPDPSQAGNVGSLDSNGNIEVNVISLDEFFQNLDISLIKMDIEGAELDALRGAAKLIRKNKPKLVISIYHKRDDIFELPLFIHHLYPGYKLYFRHYSTTFSETVLFAVP